jgi:hypothetical protein
MSVHWHGDVGVAVNSVNVYMTGPDLFRSRFTGWPTTDEPGVGHLRPGTGTTRVTNPAA